MYNISTLCPTRGRPYQCEEMVKSWINSTSNSELIIYYQDDDTPENLKKYQELEATYNHKDIKWVHGERLTSGHIWNKLYEEYSTAPILHLGSDDLYYKTKDWDIKVKEVANRFEDEIYCISVREGGKEDRGGIICRHPVISRKMAQAVGYFYPPFFIHYNVDIFWRDVTKALNRFVIMDLSVIIGHVRNKATDEHDWRKEFYTGKGDTLKSNYIWARDKYIMNTQIDRYKKFEINTLRRFMK